MTPKPIKRATRAAGSVLNPIDTAQRVVEDAVVAGARGGKGRRKKNPPRAGGKSEERHPPTLTMTPDAAGELILERHPILALVLKRQVEYQAQAEAAKSTGDRLLALTVEMHVCNLAATELKPTLETANALAADGVFDVGVFKDWADPVVKKLNHEIDVGSKEALAAVDKIDDAEGDALGERASKAIEQIDSEVAALRA